MPSDETDASLRVSPTREPPRSTRRVLLTVGTGPSRFKGSGPVPPLPAGMSVGSMCVCSPWSAGLLPVRGGGAGVLRPPGGPRPPPPPFDPGRVPPLAVATGLPNHGAWSAGFGADGRPGSGTEGSGPPGAGQQGPDRHDGAALGGRPAAPVPGHPTRRAGVAGGDEGVVADLVAVPAGRALRVDRLVVPARHGAAARELRRRRLQAGRRAAPAPRQVRGDARGPDASADAVRPGRRGRRPPPAASRRGEGTLRRPAGTATAGGEGRLSMPWRGPSYPGELPTLGYQVLGWIEGMLAAPDRPGYEPLILTREQAQFVVNFYALDPVTGRR